MKAKKDSAILARLDELTAGIATRVEEWASIPGDAGYRSFYGETFALAFLAGNGTLRPATAETLLRRYAALDRTDSQFHWEFNNYALLRYRTISGDPRAGAFLSPLRFKNTPCTNWTLLRCVSKLLAGKDASAAVREAHAILGKSQLDSGLILDEPPVRSFQYHSFSLAMLGDLSMLTGERGFAERFRLGTAFIRRFILPNGDFNYIGRGQYQSFGYGALIYALSLAYSISHDPTLLGDIELLISFLERYRRPDGGLPLVLNGKEPAIPTVIDVRDPSYAGWYPYNNYFDYLPALGFFLMRAKQVIEQAGGSGETTYSPQESYRDKFFIKEVTPRYIAVLAKPGGYWTNDMPMPYLYYRGESRTPCYGGEQFQRSIYDTGGIPLPYHERFGISLRRWSRSFFTGTTLMMLSPLGMLERAFSFEPEGITIRSMVRSPFAFRHRYLFKQEFAPDTAAPDTGAAIVAAGALVPAGTAYSAAGQLRVYRDESGNESILRIRLP